MFRRSARLELKSGASIQAEKVEVRPRPGAPAVELYFPRADMLGGEKAVEFSMTAGEYALESKFKISVMMYRGRLEL